MRAVTLLGGGVRLSAVQPAFLEDHHLVELYERVVRALSVEFADLALAEDLAQEALIRYWLRRTAVRDPSAWTYRCASNLGRSRFRRMAAEGRALRRAESGSGRQALLTTADEVAAQHRQEVQALVASLPNRQREAVILVYLLDRTPEQAAASMGCAVGTVKAHIAKALVSLRRNAGGTTMQEQMAEASERTALPT